MTASGPSIHLYVHSDLFSNEEENGDKSNYESLVELYREFLLKDGRPQEGKLVETDLAADPQLYQELTQRFGTPLRLPGILLNNVWVHGLDSRDLQTAWSKAWFDHVWHAKSNQKKDNNQQKDDNNKDDGSIEVPSSPKGLIEYEEQLGESLRSYTTQGASVYTSSSSSEDMFGLITLPNGKTTEMGELLRFLMRSIKHSYNAEDHYYYFRGFEGFDLWSSLYCESAREDVTEFANVLIEKGIVHNYTPKCTDLRKSFLVLRPLKDPYVLNSFVEWSSGTQTDKDTDPYGFVLNLSELMDKICKTDYRENLQLYHKFEMECCQLQTLPFPEDLMQRVAFTLNVYNMAVRHAVICCHERQWTWPTDLESLHALFKKLCYNINGECVTIAALQAILYSNEKFRMPKLVPQPAGFWNLFSLCRGDSSPSTGTSYYYRDSIIATDTRLLFAMTLGIKGSPSVKTIYADRLEEALETATKVYAREHIKITSDGVELPALTGWFRKEMGETAGEVLYYLLPYINREQMDFLHDNFERDVMQAWFGHGEDDWKPGFSTLTTETIIEGMNADEIIDALVAPPIGADKPSQDQDEFSLPPAPELTDPASDFMDQTALYLPRNLMPSKSSKSLKSQSSFGIIRRLWGRNPSVGDLAPDRPGVLDKTETDYDEDITLDDRSLFRSDGSMFRSDLSEITFGSDFQDLSLGRRRR